MDGHRATLVRPSLAPLLGLLPLGALPLSALLLSALLLSESGCAGSTVSNASSKTPKETSGQSVCADGSAPSQAVVLEEALPRYFSLELSGNQAHVDGALLSGSALSRRIEQEAQSADNDGAVVRVRDEASGEVLGALVWELSSAGFEHIIISQGEAPRPSAASEPPASESDASSPRPANAGAAEPGAALKSAPDLSSGPALEAPTSVKVRSIGLHVGGGPNDDTTKAKFIAPIEQRFDALGRCHRLAPNGDRNASLGVDLLIDTRGGRATLKELRTALSGKDFEQCVRAAFDQVEFPAIARPTVVSYSMLFEPGPR
jgi:hypothetical protein